MPAFTEELRQYLGTVGGRAQKGNGEDIGAPRPFVFIPFERLAADIKPPEYVIDEILERDVVVVVFGDSDTYKTFVVLGWGLHVAAGIPWHGRPVRRGSVFYIKGEGHSGFGRRVQAWRLMSRVQASIPFYASERAGELVDPESLEAIIASIRATVSDAGDTPELIVIDTLDANFGPGDESKTADMRLFVAAASRLREAFGCAVVVVHHVGHGDKERERGAYNLRGGVDGRILIMRDPQAPDARRCLLKFLKTKDGPTPEALALDLAPVELGIADAQGRPVSSLIVERVEEFLPPTDGDLSDNHDAALGLLRKLLEEHRERLDRQGHDPGKARVSWEDWRDRCYDAGVFEGKYRRQNFSKAKRALIKSKLVRVEGIFAWPAGEV